ncbi:unnamed protein product [Tuber melanosporum]|uniref:(Perigord truffle) hypothetical protein n=1 Tax=Tuber melanosporum (strain Mel28) TaxID=656061 RepID=D5GDL8_TUBMM|nr:uncharacterized protein GSTUM_00001085001 [Tuber melanosporum]CAZ82611.1 unnamed protein product [Tuber melanosporum]
MLSARILARTTRTQPRILQQARRLATESAPKRTESIFVKEREAVKQHAAQSSELWRKLSIYLVIPAVVLAGINAYKLWNEHWEHWAHMPPLEERTEYPYQNIRTKNYFWGNGDKLERQGQLPQARRVRRSGFVVITRREGCLRIKHGV